MTLKEYAKIAKKFVAPYFGGNIRVVLIRHWGWTQSKEWGKRANLTNADLRCANLSNADLSNADLTNANLIYAKLTNADLRCANLSNADLTNASLTYANLTNAKLMGGKNEHGEILHVLSITGAYDYAIVVFIHADGSVWVRMGCKFQSIGQWGANWYNNDNEYPRGGKETKQRMLAYRFAVASAKNWKEAHK